MTVRWGLKTDGPVEDSPYWKYCSKIVTGDKFKWAEERGQRSNIELGVFL